MEESIAKFAERLNHEPVWIPPTLDIVESTVLELLKNGSLRSEITNILGFDLSVVFASLVEKNYIYPDGRTKYEFNMEG